MAEKEEEVAVILDAKGRPIPVPVHVAVPEVLPVLVIAEQPPIPMMQIAPDGVTPVPIPALGADANTIPGEAAPIPGYKPDTQGISVPTPSTPTTGSPGTVTVTAPSPARPDVIKGEGATLAPTTTEQQDVTLEGQRRINLIWETTQSRIAIMVVVAGVLVNTLIIVFIIFLNKEVSVTQLALISISLQFLNLTVGIIIGFYFSRTNHSAQGGVGPRMSEAPYTGR